MIVFSTNLPPKDLVDDPHLNQGGLLDVTLQNGDKVKLPALPIEMNKQKFGLRHNPPTEGDNAQQILANLGYSKEHIEQLIADNVLRSH